jgi:hypothetical protein
MGRGWHETRDARKMALMRAALIVLVILLSAAIYSCATTGPNPCIGTYAQRQTMPCQCPGTLDPVCPPWITDAVRADGGVPTPPPGR